jgi:hypothetical protein
MTNRVFNVHSLDFFPDASNHLSKDSSHHLIQAEIQSRLGLIPDSGHGNQNVPHRQAKISVVENEMRRNRIWVTVGAIILKRRSSGATVRFSLLTP